MKKRRQFTAKFKTKVVLEAIGGMSTMSEIASKYELHPIQVSKWRSKFLKEAEQIFSGDIKKKDEAKDDLIEELYKQIGQSKVEVDWLKKKVGLIS
jgi:transposase-like protein